MPPLIAAQPDAATARAYWTLSRGERERLFGAARRHSRHVRLMRIGLPAGMVLSLAMFVAWRAFSPVDLLPDKSPAGISDLVVSGSTITMAFTRDMRPYELVARQASQEISTPDVVEMRDIRARLQMPDKSTAEVTAHDGVFDSKNEILKLGKNVVLNAKDYTVWLNDAVVNVRTSNIVTEQPVEVKMLQGTLNARRLEVVDSGEVLRFDGGVTMTLNRGNPLSTSTPAPGSPPPAARTQTQRAR